MLKNARLLYLTIALQKLGTAVVKTTHADAALAYLSAGTYTALTASLLPEEVRAAMDATGVDFAMDVHGDEAIPANFIAGFEGIPSWTERQGKLYDAYLAALLKASPDFQTKLGSPIAKPRKGNLSMSTNQVAERYGCVAMTLEMPFKDNHELPDADFGWSPERCALLGRACLSALLDMIDEIPA